MKNNQTLVGVKRFISKKGKEYAVLQTTVPFNDREIESGCTGIKVEEIFVPDGLMIRLDSLSINKPIHFDYEIVGNRAYVADFYTDK